MKRTIKNGYEEDVLADRGRWRRIYCYTQRAGVTSGIKRAIRRRERREAKSGIRHSRE